VGFLTVLPTKPCPSPREGPTIGECPDGPTMEALTAEGPIMVAVGPRRERCNF